MDSTSNEIKSTLKKKYQYALDVLTDGSEYTGNGIVFLTVSRPSSTSTAEKDSFNDDKILARYALSGVSTLISRLAADQALKLSSVRAVFCPSRKDVDYIAGLPSLLLSLANYSLNGKIHVVGDEGMDGFMDHVNDLVLKRRNYPEIMTCIVPSNDASTWWKVYDDEYIVVHARIGVGESDDDSEDSGESVDSEDYSSQESSEPKEHADEQDPTSVDLAIVYIVTLQNTPHPYSFAIFPSRTNSTAHPNILYPLPDNIGVGQKKSSSEKPLEFILHMNPSYTKSFGDETQLQISKELRGAAKRHLATIPCNLPGKYDNGLLIRALHQTRTLHKHLPFAFPDSSTDYKSVAVRANELCTEINIKDSMVAIQRLESCSSVFLETGEAASTKEMCILHRQERMIEKISNRRDELSISSISELEIIQSDVDEASAFYMAKCASNDNTEKQDDNEIDLSDDDDDDDEGVMDRPVKRIRMIDCPLDDLDVRVPHLLVLGTGCASPSPLRGSSGYAIFLPTIIGGAFVLVPSVVLECGEGFLTMLHRHASIKQSMQQYLCQIRLIWISHAHLDHYGGLPHLIHEIVKVNKQTTMCTCYQKVLKRENRVPSMSKDADAGMHRSICKRCSRTCPPIVIAPSKVLRYLDCALNCKNGIIGGQKMYVGISQRDFDTSPFSQQVRNDVFGIELTMTNDPTSPLATDETRTYCPIQFLKNIPVEHCPNAYACLIGLNTISLDDQQSQNLFTLCYSGDTRPTFNIVRGCRDFSKACGRNVSLLLHEATFDDDEKGKGEAIRKRHSTVEEAMGIARQIGLDSVLMTHFSQRYPKFPPGYDAEAVRGESRNASSKAGLEVASAYDGMLIPLKDGLRAMLPLVGSLAALILTLDSCQQHNE